MSEKSLNQLLVEVQQAIPPIEHNQKVQFKGVKFSYADLPSIHKIVKPILNAKGLFVSYPIQKDSIRCVITGGSEYIESEVEFHPTSDPKQTGSLITYYKRYLLCALLAIDAEQDVDAPSNEPTVKKVHLNDKAFKSAQERIAKGEQGVINKCLAYFDMTEEQHDVLLNLDLEYNG